jgi:hypothetical protein
MITNTSDNTNNYGTLNYAKELFKSTSQPELCPIKFAWDITARYDLLSCTKLVESGQIFYIPEIIYQS